MHATTTPYHFNIDPYTLKSPIPIRLVDGSHSEEGRVEVNVKGEWGTINYRYWDIRDANVVCRMLGYKFAIRAGRASSLGFRSGSGPIWFRNLNCLGSERSITNCSIYTQWLYTAYYYYYSHYYDAGVVCYTGWYIVIELSIQSVAI